MAKENKKWRKMSINEASFMGEVVGNPENNNGYMLFQLLTTATVKDENGQFTDVDQIIPLIAEPGSNANTVERYVQEGRHLHVSCSFRSWEDGYGFFVRKVTLGDKPYVPKEDSRPF